MADIIKIIVSGIVPAAPALVIWITAVILTTIVFRRSGGKAERLLLAGAVIYLVSSLLLIPSPIIFWEMVSNEPENISTVATWITMIRKIIAMTGLVCFLSAFWVKFKKDSMPANAD